MAGRATANGDRVGVAGLYGEPGPSLSGLPNSTGRLSSVEWTDRNCRMTDYNLNVLQVDDPLLALVEAAAKNGERDASGAEDEFMGSPVQNRGI